MGSALLAGAAAGASLESGQLTPFGSIALIFACFVLAIAVVSTLFQR